MDPANRVRGIRRLFTAKLETMVNIAVLLAALLVAAFFVDLLITRNSGRPAAAAAPGSQLALPASYDFGAHRRTLILALQDGCSYCEESMPFYRRLAAAVAPGCSEIGIVAVLPQTRAVADELLTRHELDLPRLSDVSLASLGVPGTPTLLLVDPTGKVLDVWVGRLSREREEDVLSALEAIPACS